MMKTLRRSFIAMCCLALVGGCATPASKSSYHPTLPQKRMVELMGNRLDLASQVAWVKFRDTLPVYDPKREAELLAGLVSKGEAKGVPALQVEAFMKAQMAASRAIQKTLIRSWSRGGTLPAYPPFDLKRDIRPKLDAISDEMIVLLPAVGQSPAFASYAAAELSNRGYRRVATLATAPLR